MAIEARANHLLEEQLAQRRMTEELCEAALWLRPQDKWFLLPEIARRRRRIFAVRLPHSAIAEICNRRNNLVHVNFARLKNLPSATEMMNLYRGFIDAMEDMNVVLGRARKPRREVMALKRL